MKSRGEPILRVEHLSTSFRTDRGVVTAVDDVSFDLFKGETLGIVGESGCGKTVTSKSIMRLLPEHLTLYGPASRVGFDGLDLIAAGEQQTRALLDSIQK
jgi:ABC-type dipeptide/oligopeptide/nickel transport system ATPase component